MTESRLVVVGGNVPPNTARFRGISVDLATRDTLTKLLPTATTMLVRDFAGTWIPAVIADSGDRLSWVHVNSVGVDHLLTPDLVESDIVVTNSSGVLDQAIAEYVLATMLAFAKRLPGSFRRQQRGQWRHEPSQRLTGSTALVIGPGAIGAATAALLRQVGVLVDAVGRSGKREEHGPFGEVFTAGELAGRVGDYDHVIVTAPLTALTRGMIDSRVLDAMKPTACLINVARGEIVDEPALVAALQTGAIACAALDVFASEPLPQGHPLWSLPNAIITSHMAGDFIGWRAAQEELFLDNLGRFISGLPLLNQVDKRLGYVPWSALRHNGVGHPLPEQADGSAAP
jgi:phosphoglycerate dehydrogenase-like enzyme